MLRQPTRGVCHLGKVFGDIHSTKVLGGDSLGFLGPLSLHVLEKATKNIVIVDILEDLAPKRLEEEATERVRLWNEDTV